MIIKVTLEPENEAERNSFDGMKTISMTAEQWALTTGVGTPFTLTAECSRGPYWEG